MDGFGGEQAFANREQFVAAAAFHFGLTVIQPMAVQLREGLQTYAVSSDKNNNKSTLDNSPPPILNLKLLRPQGKIIDVKCKKSQ